jgi:hypothetical protein
MAAHPKYGWLLAGALALAVFVGHGWVRHGRPAWLGVVLPDSASVSQPPATRATATARVKKRTDPEPDHIRKAGDLVCDFGCCHVRQPWDMAEVRDWAVRQGKARPEDFCSTRDGCLYDFLNRSVAIIEHTGRDGRRFAYDPAMGPVELTEGVLKVLADSGRVNPGARPDPGNVRGAGPCCPVPAAPPD